MANKILESLFAFFGVGRKEGPSRVDFQRTEPLIAVDRELRAWSQFYNYAKSRTGRYFLSTMFGDVVQNRSQLIDMVNAYKDTFFHQMIVNMLVDDVLNVDPVTNNVVDLVTENEVLEPIIESLQERIDVDGFISSIIEDVIAYGDYVVRVVHDGREVKGLEDDVDQKKVVVLYKSGRPVCLVDTSQDVRDDERIKQYTEFLHFSVSPRRLRLKLSANAIAEVKAKGYDFSEYVRIGKPLFWGAWDLLNSLYVLTVFYPIFAVQKLNATTVIGLRVPPETTPERAWELARKYQELLNVYTSVDERGRVSLADVIDTVGRYKVVPVWGDEKGFLQLADPRLEESFALDILQDLREQLCATLGVPYHFLFGSKEGMSKLDVLKSFSRYVKKVASIQRAIREGLLHLVRIELALKGLKVNVQEVEVRFRNQLVSVEALDKLEFISGMMEVVRSAVDYIQQLGEAVGAEVDREKLLQFLNDYFGMVSLDGVLKLKKEETEPPPASDVMQAPEPFEWEVEEEEPEEDMGEEEGVFPEESFLKKWGRLNEV